MIDLTAKIRPQTKERVRFNYRTKKFYTPAKTLNYERDLGELLRAQHEGNPLTGPLVVDVWLYPDKVRVAIERAKHASRIRGDIDNLAKAVLDAGNGVLWVDDKQIVTLNIVKQQATK